MYRLYALCGGILLGLLLLEIIPETFSSYEMIGPILGMAIGILIMSLLDNYCHHPMIHTKDQQAWQTFLFSLSLYLFIICRVDLLWVLLLLIMLTLPYLFNSNRRSPYS